MSDWYDTYQAHASSDWAPTQLSPEDEQMLKSQQHPTAWMEYFMRETGEDPNSLGLRNPDEAREYSRSARRKEAK